MRHRVFIIAATASVRATARHLHECRLSDTPRRPRRLPETQNRQRNGPRHRAMATSPSDNVKAPQHLKTRRARTGSVVISQSVVPPAASYHRTRASGCFVRSSSYWHSSWMPIHSSQAPVLPLACAERTPSRHDLSSLTRRRGDAERHRRARVKFKFIFHAESAPSSSSSSYRGHRRRRWRPTPTCPLSVIAPTDQSRR